MIIGSMGAGLLASSLGAMVIAADLMGGDGFVAPVTFAAVAAA
jgi:hypothetical protein